MARPTKFSLIKARKIVEGLKAGMTRTAAAGLVDVSQDSLQRWCQRSAMFAEHVAQAEAEAEARYTQVIARAAFGYEVRKTKTTERLGVDGTPVIETVTETSRDSDWRAALEWLKRRRKGDWSERTEVMGGEGEPIVLKVVYEEQKLRE
jgi:hypothetical protein